MTHEAAGLLPQLDQIADVAVDLKQPLEGIAAGGQSSTRRPARDQREAHRPGTQRQLRDDPGNLPRLRSIGLQELPPRRQVVEEVLDVDPACPQGTRRR